MCGTCRPRVFACGVCNSWRTWVLRRAVVGVPLAHNRLQPWGSTAVDLEGKGGGERRRKSIGRAQRVCRE